MRQWLSAKYDATWWWRLLLLYGAVAIHLGLTGLLIHALAGLHEWVAGPVSILWTIAFAAYFAWLVSDPRVREDSTA